MSSPDSRERPPSATDELTMATESPSPSARGSRRQQQRRRRQRQLWGHKHLPLLLGASSKDSVEYILQALWRTRNTGLDSADRAVFLDVLRLPSASSSSSDLDPLLVCLRMLIRSCVYGNTPKEEIQKLFPPDVSPELQKLLTLLLQKFQSEWKDDVQKDQAGKEASLGETGGNFVNAKGDQAANNEETNKSE